MKSMPILQIFESIIICHSMDELTRVIQYEISLCPADDIVLVDETRASVSTKLGQDKP